MRVPYRRLSTTDEVLRLVTELAPRTVILKLSAAPEIAAIGFATNSTRAFQVPPTRPSLSLFYLASAQKPLRVAPYRTLPAPGVLVGDQVATDGTLAWRLGYTFVHYCPDIPVPRGPRLMRQIGRLFTPLLFERER